MSNEKIKKWAIPLAHILVWLLLFSIPFFSMTEHRPMHPQLRMPPPAHTRNDMLYLSLVTNILLVIIFYLNLIFFAPVFTQRKKYGKYVAIQIGVTFLFYMLLHYILPWILLFDRHMPLGIQLFSYIIVVLGSLCYSLISEHIKAEQIKKENENERLHAELTFLRWQVSPHFFFNVLNSLVSLARVRSEKLEGMLINLSSLMRYMLYETGEQRISVERELEYLKSYINIQKMRFGNEVKVISSIDTDGTDSNDTIEPMLIIPFIENAYKHGTGLVSDPIIYIYIEAKQKMFTMTVKNKYQPITNAMEPKDETKGVGLSNVKRRLNLLYPSKHSLSISNEHGWYISTLEINIS